jgi:glycosyltransferase involved in cell wall biosynthesis
MARSVFGAFRVMFFHGDGSLQRFRSLFGEPTAEVQIIPHGNEALIVGMADAGGHLRGRYGIPPERPVALFFGGLRPSKGLPDLVDAFSIVRRETPATLVIAGHPTTGFDPQRLIGQAERLGIAGDVVIDARYLPLEEVGPFIRTGSVVVLPYRSATASGVLQVAYAFGRPVIVTEVGDLPGSVEHGVTGLIVPPGDAEALARAIVKMLVDPEESSAMGASARRAAETRFAWGPIATRILGAYREST